MNKRRESGSSSVTGTELACSYGTVLTDVQTPAVMHLLPRAKPPFPAPPRLINTIDGSCGGGNKRAHSSASALRPSPALLRLHHLLPLLPRTKRHLIPTAALLRESEMESDGGGGGGLAGGGGATSAKCDNRVVFLLNSELNTERSDCRAGAPRPPCCSALACSTQQLVLYANGLTLSQGSKALLASPKTTFVAITKVTAVSRGHHLMDSSAMSALWWLSAVRDGAVHGHDNDNIHRSLLHQLQQPLTPCPDSQMAPRWC